MRIRLFAKSLCFLLLSLTVAGVGATAFLAKSESSVQPQDAPFVFQRGFYEVTGPNAFSARSEAGRGFYLHRSPDDVSHSKNFVLGYHYTSGGKPSWFMSYIQNSPEVIMNSSSPGQELTTFPSVNYNVQVKPATSSAPMSLEVMPFPLKLNWILSPYGRFAAYVYINNGLSRRAMSYQPPGIARTMLTTPDLLSNLWVAMGKSDSTKPRGLAIDVNAINSEKNELRAVLFDYDADGKPIWYETRGLVALDPRAENVYAAQNVYEGTWGVHEGGSPLQDEYRLPSFKAVAKARITIMPIQGTQWGDNRIDHLEVTTPNGEVISFEAFDKHISSESVRSTN